MSTADKLLLALLLVVAAVLGFTELMFLPLRMDGAILPRLANLPVPASALLALVTMPWLSRAASDLSPRGLVSASPLLVWLLVIGVFGLAGPGGDIVLIPDWRTLLLLACGAFPAAVVLGSRVGLPTDDHR
ncbi:hypothetical protein [Labedaea rhizosphaerae]|uniref:Uncharacterized protein n=1 Tax=Labedaea rhizosphaerae TaxID=598644 RepID=A0A4V3D024_LABRH|nr:hypothetical protein [Labedaea rhizosphaerae]TDQ04145.1 hypothetical protein EV186_10186 [Labedaea rhizosphaerae]